MSTPTLHLLCAGAAQGLVKALQQTFTEATGADVQARFGAVGAMKEALLAGERCDVMVVTQPMAVALGAAGRLAVAGRADLGRVRTGVAVRTGTPRPRVDTPEALRTALRAADALYFPDPLRATAGIHFARVMRELGVHDELAPRFRAHPNGATAMRELAASDSAQPIGCTQVSEILYSPGVELVGALPERFELATVYTAAVATQAADPALALRFIEALAGPASQALRARGGFER
jgi:molybdate transport system substrate-binding protein